MMPNQRYGNKVRTSMAVMYIYKHDLGIKKEEAINLPDPYFKNYLKIIGRAYI